jgi:hypothetical protein
VVRLALLGHEMHKALFTENLIIYYCVFCISVKLILECCSQIVFQENAHVSENKTGRHYTYPVLAYITPWYVLCLWDSVLFFSKLGIVLLSNILLGTK